MSKKTPASQCLQKLLSLYGLHKSADRLAEIAAFSEPRSINQESLAACGDELGVSLYMRSISGETINGVKEPGMLVHNGAVCCVYVPDHKGREASLKLYLPDEGMIKGKQAAQKLQSLRFDHIVTVHKMVGSEGLHPHYMHNEHRIDWFWQPVFSYLKNYAEIIICSFFINLFAIAIPLFTMNVYDKVVPNFAEATLIALTTGVVIVLLFDFLLKTMRAYILERVSTDLSTRFDVDLMERFFSFPALSLNMSIGEKTSIFKELQGIRDFYAFRLAPALVDFPFFILFIIVIYSLSPLLAVVPLVGGLLMIALNIGAQAYVRKTTKKYFSDSQSKSSALVELLSGMETIKLFNAASAHLFRWRTLSAQTAQSAGRSQFVTALAQNFSLTIMYMVNVSVVFLGVYEIEKGALTIGGLIACTILSSRAIAPIMNVAVVGSQFKKSWDVLKTINKLFLLPQDNDLSRNYEDEERFKGKIELRDAVFQYPGQPVLALNGVSLTIEPGQKVGLIGQTGAGKTTLAKLVTGLIRPQQGSVFMDDYEVSAVHPYQWRRMIGVVPQNPHFFAGTIRENVLLGREGITEEAFDRAVKYSGLDLFVQQTGQGLDAEVGEQGDNISGGQRQAIALARALVSDPPIIILDEPTNGMDRSLEVKVMDELKPYLKDKTFIMVTHRTTLLPLVERLILLNKGRIVADGPRDVVLKKLSGA